ncbi:MAG: hypothetical protein GYB23_17925 [Vibrionaceae bacterium]|nr:hypothetical protein [Vibrionaceae bacterium]
MSYGFLIFVSIALMTIVLTPYQEKARCSKCSSQRIERTSPTLRSRLKRLVRRTISHSSQKPDSISDWNLY